MSYQRTVTRRTALDEIASDFDAYDMLKRAGDERSYMADQLHENIRFLMGLVRKAEDNDDETASTQ